MKQILQQIIDKDDSLIDNPLVVEAMNNNAWEKAYESNIKNNRLDKINNPEKYITIGFNPFNYQQLKKMWIYLGLESEEISTQTGEMSFSTPILKELVKIVSNEDTKQILEYYLEIAQAKNIITQYIPKYLGSTIDERVYGSLRLLGTLSGRLSGKAAKMEDENKHKTGINLVTQPASSSVFAKPVKQLFTASKGKILFASDFNNLEGHISGILTKDKTKLAILNGEFEDMHTLHACYYFKEQIEQELGVDLSEITPEVVSELFHNKDFKNIRSNGKPISFGLDYGAYPKKIAKQLGCNLEVAQLIFDRYHKELYQGVTKFREDYVLPTSKEQGYIHLNYGLRLYSDNVEKDIRTLFNANFQSYSVLTQIVLVEFHKAIIKDNMQDKVKLTNTIHDAIYGEMDDDIEVIKWVNDTLIAIMTRQFVHNQSVQLKSEVDIGYNLYDMVTLSNSCSVEKIQVLKDTLERKMEK